MSYNNHSYEVKAFHVADPGSIQLIPEYRTQIHQPLLQKKKNLHDQQNQCYDGTTASIIQYANL